MKIVHLCLCGPVTDGWTYQDNMLTKYHHLAEHNVTIITSQWVWGSDGKLAFDNREDYINCDGVRTIRLPIKKGNVNSKFKKYIGLNEVLEKEKPEILFIHGCQFLDARIVAKYLKKHSDITVYVDNHADHSNSATNFISEWVLHKGFWRYTAHKLLPYTKRFYGVLPARVDFLIKEYGIPAEKVELLVMGADDESVEKSAEPKVRTEIRAKCGLADDDFVIMTGGKIDAFKTQTLLLMEAVKSIDNPKVKLIVFGSVTPELKEKVNALADGEKVQYIGWVQAKDSYNYFASSDLVVFPGRHSVFWEQVAAQGKPMLVKYWNGTTHVDCGGNVKFLTDDTAEEIKNAIQDILDGDNYKNMLEAAKKASASFMYSEIAKRSIEL